MLLTRRQFAACMPALLGAPAFTFADSASPLFLSAASDSADTHWVIGFEENGDQVAEKFRHALPGRAHHIAVNTVLGIYIVVARRPGKYLWIGDLATGNPLGQIEVPGDRHLYGHGIFETDGSRFYTTENAWQLVNGDSGRIVTWQVSRHGDTVTLDRGAEFPSYGVGPHELLLASSRDVLVVANGGIRTHPEQPREKLNLNSMQPSLVYIDARDGMLLEQHFLDADWHQASIRHMDINASGEIVMGLQYEGEPFDRVPLVALHRRGEAVRTLWAPEPQQGQMKQYVGSVRFDASGDFFAATCPRGNMITIWATASGEMITSLRSRDGCGICASPNGFLYTAGTGRISHYDPAADSITEFDTTATGKVFWDNHLSAWGVS